MALLTLCETKCIINSLETERERGYYTSVLALANA